MKKTQKEPVVAQTDLTEEEQLQVEKYKASLLKSGTLTEEQVEHMAGKYAFGILLYRMNQSKTKTIPPGARKSTAPTARTSVAPPPPRKASGTRMKSVSVEAKPSKKTG